MDVLALDEIPEPHPENILAHVGDIHMAWVSVRRIGDYRVSGRKIVVRNHQVGWRVPDLTRIVFVNVCTDGAANINATGLIEDGYT